MIKENYRIYIFHNLHLNVRSQMLQIQYMSV